jgi:hypothetical protein
MEADVEQDAMAIKHWKRRKLDSHLDTTFKVDMVSIMLETGRCGTKREAIRAYDAVTAALNGWLMVWTKRLPIGTHAKVFLHNAFSVNLCWIEGKEKRYPKVWITLTDKARNQFRKLKLQCPTLDIEQDKLVTHEDSNN